MLQVSQHTGERHFAIDFIQEYILSFLHSFYLPDVLCDITNAIWRQGFPLEAMTGRTAFISLLAKGLGFSSAVS